LPFPPPLTLPHSLCSVSFLSRRDQACFSGSVFSSPSFVVPATFLGVVLSLASTFRSTRGQLFPSGSPACGHVPWCVSETKRNSLSFCDFYEYFLVLQSDDPSCFFFLSAGYIPDNFFFLGSDVECFFFALLFEISSSPSGRF